MKKHIGWISVVISVVVVIALLHLLVFAPLGKRYKDAQSGLDQKIGQLKRQISSVEWMGTPPDPRDPGFTWSGLLRNVEENFETRLASYKRLIENIELGVPEYDSNNLTPIILERLKSLQKIEEANPRKLVVLSKWGLNTVTERGYNGTRSLDLRQGGYRSYAGEERIQGKQGTLQLMVNIAPWYNFPDKQPPTQILFHAGREAVKGPDSPDGADAEYQSELTIMRQGEELIAEIRDGNKMSSQRMDIYPWLDRNTAGDAWKRLRVTWGPDPDDFNFYVDGQPVSEMQPSTAGRRSPSRGSAMSPMGAMMPGMNMMMFGRTSEGGGTTSRRAAPTTVTDEGISLKAPDGFVIGCNLRLKNPARLMFDAVRIWDVVSREGEPGVEPLFAEDYENPFASQREMERGLEQLVRYYRGIFDPLNDQSVRNNNMKWFAIQSGFWGSNNGMQTDRSDWINTLYLVAFLDYAVTSVPRYGNMIRLIQLTGIPIPPPDQFAHLIVFLDLAVDVAEQLVEADVERLEELRFLTWSTTVSDEPLKLAFKEAFKKLENEIQSGGGASAMGMGMGMSSPFMPMGGGMAGGGGNMTAEERMKAREEMIRKRKEALEERQRKRREAEENKARYARWTEFYLTEQIPPEFYTQFLQQVAKTGGGFFKRYSLMINGMVRRDRLARTMHLLEYGGRLGFISHLVLNPIPNDPNLSSFNCKVDYCFMEKADIEEQGQPTSAQAPAAPGVPRPPG